MLSILFRVNILTQTAHTKILRVAGVRVSATRTVSGRRSRRAVGPLLRFNIVTRAPLVNSEHLMFPPRHATYSLTHNFSKGTYCSFKLSLQQSPIWIPRIRSVIFVVSFGPRASPRLCALTMLESLSESYHLGNRAFQGIVGLVETRHRAKVPTNTG